MKRFARDGAAAIPATCERHKTFDEIRVFLRAAIFAASAPRKKISSAGTMNPSMAAILCSANFFENYLRKTRRACLSKV